VSGGQAAPRRAPAADYARQPCGYRRRSRTKRSVHCIPPVHKTPQLDASNAPGRVHAARVELTLWRLESRLIRIAAAPRARAGRARGVGQPVRYPSGTSVIVALSTTKPTLPPTHETATVSPELVEITAWSGTATNDENAPSEGKEAFAAP